MDLTGVVDANTQAFIQAFEIVSDRLSRIEDSFDDLAKILVENEKNKLSGRLNSAALGWPFKVEVFTSSEESATYHISCAWEPSSGFSLFSQKTDDFDFDHKNSRFTIQHVYQHGITVVTSSKAPDFPTLIKTFLDRLETCFGIGVKTIQSIYVAHVSSAFVAATWDSTNDPEKYTEAFLSMLRHASGGSASARAKFCRNVKADCAGMKANVRNGLICPTFLDEFFEYERKTRPPY